MRIVSKETALKNNKLEAIYEADESLEDNSKTKNFIVSSNEDSIN